MEMTLFSAIGATLKTAQESINIALESRDLIKNAAVIQQLSSAQQSVLSLTAQLFELQNKYLETAEELTKLKKALAQRESYSLFEISKGIFVYRMNVAPESSGAGNPGTAEPVHYVCQTCFDRGIKSVLQRSNDGWWQITLDCNICGQKFATGERIPKNGPGLIGESYT
jgi:hypothetical protein